MERLTYWCDDGMGGGEYRVNENGTEYSGHSIDRLAAYEDTGLEPEEISGLQAPTECSKLPKWISVEDALPEPGHRILFTDGVFVGEGYMTQSQHFERYYAGRVEGVLGITVTHWMPLPEPPEERRADG